MLAIVFMFEFDFVVGFVFSVLIGYCSLFFEFCF